MRLKKKFLLIIIFASLVCSCTKVTEDLIETSDTIITKFQSEFNREDFLNTIPYDYTVKWENPSKLYSEELEMAYYEFSIDYSSKLNPITLNKSKKQGDYYHKYKVFVTEDEKKNLSFYISKYFEKIDLSSSVSPTSEVFF